MNQETVITIEELQNVSEEVVMAVSNLSLQLNTNPQALTEQELQEMVNSGYIHLFLARKESDQKIVGMITLVTFRTPYKMKGTLEDLVVAEEARGQGLGEKLLTAAITKAKDKGVKSLTLTSHPTRVSANKLYQRLNFEKRDTNVYRINL